MSVNETSRGNQFETGSCLGDTYAVDYDNVKYNKTGGMSLIMYYMYYSIFNIQMLFASSTTSMSSLRFLPPRIISASPLGFNVAVCWYLGSGADPSTSTFSQAIFDKSAERVNKWISRKVECTGYVRGFN